MIWEQSGGEGRLTLNRPQTLNAWTAQCESELKQVVAGSPKSPCAWYSYARPPAFEDR